MDNDDLEDEVEGKKKKGGKTKTRKKIKVHIPPESSEESDSGEDDFMAEFDELLAAWNTKRVKYEVVLGLAPGCVLAFLSFCL